MSPLTRIQALEIINPDVAVVSKAMMKEKLAKIMKCKEDCITVFGVKNKFGGGRASAFALVYDSLDARKKYDSKKQLLKVSQSFFTSPSYCRKIFGFLDLGR